MKAMNEAVEIADKKGIVLEFSKRGTHTKKQIWYRYADGKNWLWFATSWTKANKRLKDLGRKIL
jgi:hypothetical protein